MPWSEKLNNPLDRLKPKEEKKQQNSSFYDDFQARKAQASQSVFNTPSLTAPATQKAPSGGEFETNVTPQVPMVQPMKPRQNSAFFDNHQTRSTLMNNRANGMMTPMQFPMGNAMTTPVKPMKSSIGNAMNGMTVNNNPTMINQNNIGGSNDPEPFSDFVPTPITDTTPRGNILPYFTDDLSRRMGKLSLAYEEIADSGISGAEFNNAVKMLMEDNKDIFDDYAKETNGSQLTFPGLLDMFDKAPEAVKKELQNQRVAMGIYDENYKNEIIDKMAEEKWRNEAVFLPELSDELNPEIINFIDKYNKITKTARGEDYNRALSELISENSDMIAEYENQTGRKFDIGEIGDIYKPQIAQARQNILDASYYDRLEKHYNVVFADDFDKYTKPQMPSMDQTPPLVYNRVKDNLSRMELIPYDDSISSPYSNQMLETGGLLSYANIQDNVYYDPDTGERKLVHINPKNQNEISIYTKEEMRERVKLLYMDYTEQQIYTYYLNKFGVEEAENYFKDIEMLLDQRRMQAYSTYVQQTSHDNKLYGIGMDIGSSMQQGSAYFDDLKQTFQQTFTTPDEYMPYNPYTNAAAPVHTQTVAKEGIEQDMSELGKSFTDVGLGVGENAALLLFGDAALPPIKAVSAAGNASVNSGLNGETRADKAAIWGTVKGGIEYALNKIPRDNMLEVINAPLSEKNEVLFTLLEKMGIDGTKGGISNIASVVADEFINSDKSEYELYIKRLKAGGYDDLDAKITAFKKFYIEDTLKEIMQEGLLGAISD
ncbi:MAG: hypothetical protein J1F01_01015 [Oscillospiraceae bacterium]|nr:hypothetical protein [Oscillospiraceae bacterium]